MKDTNDIAVNIEGAVASVLEQRRIGPDDIRKVIAHEGDAGYVFLNKATGHYLAGCRPANTHFWVEYRKDPDGYGIVKAYTHRMKILHGFNMPASRPDRSEEWLCARCNVFLEQATVKLTYLDETFGIDLPSCPSCQAVFISEENAVEKMALAEKMLEDK